MAEEGVRLLEDGSGIAKDGVAIRIGDFMFVVPDTFDQLDEAPIVEGPVRGRFHKGGACVGLRAFGIAQLCKMIPPKGMRKEPMVRIPSLKISLVTGTIV